MKFEQLQEFRQLAYECLGNAKDATFELADAIMTTRHVSCLGDLALNPLFRLRDTVKTDKHQAKRQG
ncbi:MAG: hypothetical protein P2A85_11355 [Microcoleus anatoxicus]|uniref:hypothetical protein n=1 Tax=Microcoleus anatoxicus TaxID=2705319 RepID=UPI00367320C1